ncbi:MAG: O-antigen ligase family protein [Bacteroidota bacterium]
MKKINLFAPALVLLTVILLFLIKLYFMQIDALLLNHISFANILLISFVGLSIAIGFYESGILKSPKSFFSSRSLLIFSLSILLVLSIFQKQVGIDATAFFVICAFIYALINRKIYALNPIYLFVFLYPLLEFFGTIGTPKGFRFPEMTYSFYLIPIAFCCFRIEKETMLRILRFLFRVMMIYMVISVVYWWYNSMHFVNIGYIEWMTQKTNVNGIAALEFVASWSRYNHPSYINLVLLPTLISGFYLFYKKREKSKISIFELFVYSVFSIFMQLIMESRIGLVEVLVIILISGLYYLHINKIYFKLALILFLFIGASGLIVLQNKVSGFISDPVRKTDSTLAINYIKKHIWWGAGYSQEAAVLKQQEELMKNELKVGLWPKTYTHNQILGTMIQFGIPGAVLLLVLVFSLMWYAFKSRSYLLQMFMLLYIFFMLIEEPLYVQEGITRFFVFLVFFIHISESDKPVKSINLFNRPIKG